MVEITRERMELVYKAQQNALNGALVIGVACSVIGIFTIKSSDIFGETGRIISLIIAFALFGVTFFNIYRVRKKIIPPGQGRIVRNAFQNMRYDYLSDKTVNMLYESIGLAKNYADKTMLTLYLCDVYQFRGQINEAISLINSIDREMFIHYPTIGMTFYSEVMGLYAMLDDTGSVLLAYKDGEKFIDECAFRNYVCCSQALSALITAETARGNYGKALQMQLMQNEFKNNMDGELRKSGQTQNYPLAQLIRGITFCTTADLYYRCGNLWEAGQTLDIGGPLVAGCPFILARANDLSAKIRQAKNEQQAGNQY